MAATINTHGLSLKQALYFGEDNELFDAVALSVQSKYLLENLSEVPHIWPDDIELALVEYKGDSESTLKQISDILTLAKGIAVYVLLQQKDADFIIQANHQGVQGFVECPAQVFNILSILHMQDRRRLGKNGNVSSVFSLKGGVGCTALSTNIAAHISDMTQGRTVLVDLNMPLGDTSLYLNMESQRLYSLTDFVYNLNRFDEDLIYKSLSRHESGLYLLPLPTDMNELDHLSGDVIKTIIQTLRRYFDHVVIDCASDLSDMTLSSLDESDNILMVSEPSLSSFRAVNTGLKLFQSLGYLKESIKLVINRSNCQKDEMINDVIDALEVDRVAHVSNDYVAFTESLKEGCLLKKSQKNSVVNAQLLNIANLLHTGSFDENLAQCEISPSSKAKGLRKWFSPKMKRDASQSLPTGKTAAVV
ncbi:CpaE family protein [Thiomicrorhabdus indica]|uniref:AAA family ATPase n=1 Tax=Thiomicrorhabdus indica TaxID=2267253 RepID=UPI002AA5E790|nr:AAA family ATPase [Thiomicrorhabdus indica]